jgi:arginine repressor
MDRRMWERHLVQAEQHVALGERHIARQYELVAKLERDGQDATEAKLFLDTLQELQATHIAHRDRLLRELAANL